MLSMVQGLCQWWRSMWYVWRQQIDSSCDMLGSMLVAHSSTTVVIIGLRHILHTQIHASGFGLITGLWCYCVG